MALGKNNVVEVEHRFEVPPAKVFAALKEGRLLYNCGAWPEGTSFDFRVGGKYRFSWGHGGATWGQFTEIVPDRRVAFTWNFDEAEVVDTKVTIDLAPDGKGCLVKLRHEGFASAEIAKMHDGGWVGGLSDFDNELVGHRVKLDREFHVPVEMLFEACAGLALFANMGATSSNSKIDFRVGGRYSATLEKGELRGEFLEIVKNKRIVMTWENAPCGEPIEKPTRVTMEFGPWGDGGKHSYLELVHEGFTTDAATVSHHTGWNSILEKIYKRGLK